MILLKISYLILIMSLYSLSFSQEIEATSLSNNQEINSTSMLPEIVELRLEFLNNDLPQESLFRLASFYLSYKCYAKAAELYALYLSRKTTEPHRSIAHYNRGLALFSIDAYDTSTKEFLLAYQGNKNYYDSLRMVGTICFLKKDKKKSLFYWQKYLSVNTNSSPERESIEKIVLLMQQKDFSFDKKDSKSTNLNKNWPFRDPDTIPYPDSGYQKKRVI